MAVDEPRPPTRPVPAWALALPVLVVVAATAAAVAISTVQKPARTALVSGSVAHLGGMAPGFSSWDLRGKKVSLADFSGRPVLLTFWATWCTACRDELPALQRIRDRYQSTGFAVLAVDYRETDSARMSEYLAGLHVDLEAVIDPQGAIANAYGVDIGLPINVLIDRKAKVTQILVGLAPPATMETAVAAVARPTTQP